MKTHFPIFAALFFATALRAQDGKTMSYHTSAGPSPQSRQEIEDIGEIDEKQPESKWRFNLTANGQFTTNAILSGNHSSGDFLFLPTFESGWHTPLGEHFSFDFSAKIESAIFAEHENRSFAGYSAAATFDYTYKPGVPRVYVMVEPYRYDSFDSGDLMTQAVGFTGGLDWGHGFNAGRSVVFAGASYSYYLADPSQDSRTSLRGVIGLAHQLRSNLTAQAYYQYQYTDYTDFGRNDHRNVLAGNLIYQFREHFFGTMTVNWINNASTQNHGSYQGFGAGLGLSLQY